jgi:hypothetical protein
VISNHNLANAGDLGDYASALELLLAPGGTVAVEFHHVLELIVEGQFDVISHSHCCYLSLLTLQQSQGRILGTGRGTQALKRWPCEGRAVLWRSWGQVSPSSPKFCRKGPKHPVPLNDVSGWPTMDSLRGRQPVLTGYESGRTPRALWLVPQQG